MKKINFIQIKSLAIVALLVSSFNANALKVTVHRKGSKDGVHYDNVYESHTAFKASLSCIDPGNTGCGWTSPPNIGGVSSTVIENFVASEIARGNNNGSTNYNNEVHVTWTFDPNTNDLNIVMDDGK